MSLVILNDDMAVLCSETILDCLQEKLSLEITRLKLGKANIKKIGDLCNEIGNIARQINEHDEKSQPGVKF